MKGRRTLSLDEEILNFLDHLDKSIYPSQSAFVEELVRKEMVLVLEKKMEQPSEPVVLSPEDEIDRNIEEMGMIRQKLGKKLNAIADVIRLELKPKEITETDVDSLCRKLTEFVRKNSGRIKDEKGKAFDISKENLLDYQRLGVLTFRNRNLERMVDNNKVETDTTPPTVQSVAPKPHGSALSKVQQVYEDIAALVREGKLGENHYDVSPEDPRCKNIIENFSALVEMLHTTEGTPENAQAKWAIKLLMNSKVPRNAP